MITSFVNNVAAENLISLPGTVLEQGFKKIQGVIYEPFLDLDILHGKAII